MTTFWQDYYIVDLTLNLELYVLKMYEEEGFFFKLQRRKTYSRCSRFVCLYVFLWFYDIPLPIIIYHYYS